MTPTAFHRVYSRTLLGCWLVLSTSYSAADSLNLSYGQLNQPYTYLDEDVSFRPVGPSLVMSFELNDNWSINADYQQWDDSLLTDSSSFETELKGFGAGVNYYLDNWSFGLSYSDSSDETSAQSIKRPNIRNIFEHTDAQSWSLSAGYGWLSGELFYNVSMSAQWSDYRRETRLTQPKAPPPGQNPPPQPSGQVDKTREFENGDITSLSSSASVARYWPLADERGVMLGAMFSWHHIFSGESVFVSHSTRGNPPRNPPPRAGGSNRNNRQNSGSNLYSAAGDDSYGQLSLYLSFDLNAQWTLDLDTAVDIASDDNGVVWSFGVGYMW